jgi:tetratricopeptide (TPR) repeat protein
MHELRLLFAKEAGAFTVQAVSPGGAGAPLSFMPFLKEADFEGLRWYLEDYMDLPDGGAAVRAARIERNLGEWGRRLYDAVFPEGHRDAVNALCAGEKPRLLTIATKEADVLRLPWELLADGRGPLTRRGVTIRRQLEMAQEPIPYPAGLPLRILLVVSRPDDLGFIDPRLTTRALLKALEPLGDDVVVDFCRPPTLLRLEEMLSAAQGRGQPYHIVHFDGHGTFVPELELSALCFEQSQPEAATNTSTDHVLADRLGALLAAYHIPLVILEACRSGQLERKAAIRSVAPRLIAAGVGSVLSMSHAVHVEATRVLLERFYRELVADVTVGQALEAGRAALLAQPNRWLEPGPYGRTVPLQDWFLPNLYQREADPRLLPAGEERFDVFLSHNHASSERVEAIARRLRDEHGLKVWLDKWYLKSGPIQLQCEKGIEKSRIVVIACTRKALESKWVEAERQMAYTRDPRGHNIIPILLEEVQLPAGLQALMSYDFRDPKSDPDNLAQLAAAIKAGVPARVVRRQPPAIGEVGAFPRPPVHQFQGRAAELYKLEQLFRGHRAVLLHALGGMGKTSLAREAAYWWARTGLVPDGACFLSFEQPASAERVVQVLGTYLEGHAFEALPADQQRRRAKQLFQERRVLMVWDNFESVQPAFQEGDGPALYGDEERARLVELFRDWTEEAEGHGRLLVTCRPAEAGLPGACRLELHGLARPDSLHLLTRVAQAAGLDLADPRLAKEKLDGLLDVLADHPLSVELVCPHLKGMTPEAIMADFQGLLPKFTGDAEVERNRSLLASLTFSTRRLSAAAQAALPWLGLFRGGVFEAILLEVSQIEPAAWEAVRAELEATALVRLERELLLNQRPYLRFHPTLAFVAAAAQVPDPDAARQRFIGVYYGVMRAVDQALRGANARGGMEVMAGEEANLRTVVRWAVAAEAYAAASDMGDTVRQYLERSGRLRELDSWVAWLAAQVQKAGFTEDAVAYQRQAARLLCTQGHAAEAVQRLQDLIQRLRATKEFDPAFQLALACGELGGLYVHTGLSVQAIPILEDAVGQCQVLVEQAKEGQDTETRQVSLAAILSRLANALRDTGRLDDALQAAERGVAIVRELGREREVAAGLGQTAQILMDQGRHQEANERYEEALQAARCAGDKALEGSLLQNQGILVCNLRHYERATGLHKRALKLFQEMNDEGSVMRTCNLLGVVEQGQGRLSEARAWFERSRQMAERRGEPTYLGQAAQNIGIICQLEGEAAQARGDKATARQRFEEAAASVQESLRIQEELGNQPDAALAHDTLARIYLRRSDLDEAEEHAHHAREIWEGLGLKEVDGVYAVLTQIAQARGNDAQAAEWQAKCDAVRAELKRRARGAGGLPPQLVQALRSLAIACARAGVDRAALDPQAETALTQVEELPAPLGALGPVLRRLAAGDLPSIPGDLPEPLGELLAQLVEAVKQARAGAG